MAEKLRFMLPILAVFIFRCLLKAKRPSFVYRGFRQAARRDGGRVLLPRTLLWAFLVVFTTTDLVAQGIRLEQVLGFDSTGIPLICGTTAEDPPRLPSDFGALLPGGTRSWEVIPNVIRDDGVEALRLEIDVNGPVADVRIDGNVAGVLIHDGPIVFSDDGLGEDRIAGDFVYTAGPFRFNTIQSLPSFYQDDAESPAGLYAYDLFSVTIEELDGSLSGFEILPRFGVLRSDIPETTTVSLNSQIVTSPHLINVQTNERSTQRYIRLLDIPGLQDLTKVLYQSLPDAFDFLILFSTNHIEAGTRNLVAGTHRRVKTNHTGTGTRYLDLDDTALYGSSSRLLSVNVLDAIGRGIFSNVVTHEISHQWVSFISPSLGLSDGAHYTNWSSVGSLVGGFLWNDNGDGTFSPDLDEGRNGSHHAPALDKYMMGLIDGNQVDDLYVSNELSVLEPVVDDFFTVTIEDIQNIEGVRSPGPAEAKRDFSLAFVAETHERLLNSTEMTFYEILARHYTKAIPKEPAPYHWFNWVSVNQFFEEGTTWHGVVLKPIFADGFE